MNPVPMSVFQADRGLSFMGSWPRSNVRHPTMSQTIDHEDPAEVIGTGLAEVIGTG